MLVAEVSSRRTSSGLRTTGRRRGSRADATSSARSLRFSVTLKKNRRAVALTLTVGTVAPIDASRSWYRRTSYAVAEEIGKAFDVADIVVLSLGTKPVDRHVLDQPPA
jgi:hypothetical protein